MEIIHNATESLREYQKQQHNASNPAYHTTPRRSHNDENWCPPPQNSLKLNVDAHCLSDGRWALGMLLRMEDGRLVGAKTEVVHGYDKAIEAEALGLKAAIEFVDWFRDCRNTTEMDVEVGSVDQFRKRRITIEMDNKGIVEAIQNGKYPRTYWGKLARNSGDYIRGDNQININWVRRNGNKAAYEFARWASLEPNKIWAGNFASLPPPVVNHIQKDMMPLIGYHL
jgi:hypothetical protein